jgi:hypothetical protein
LSPLGRTPDEDVRVNPQAPPLRGFFFVRLPGRNAIH